MDKLNAPILKNIIYFLDVHTIITVIPFVSHEFCDLSWNDFIWPVVREKWYGNKGLVGTPHVSRKHFSRQYHILNYLQENKNNKNINTEKLLELCTSEGYDEALSRILSYREPGKKLDAKYMNFFILAVKNGHLNCAKFLLNQGVDCDFKEEKTKRTPLFYASSKEMLYLLIQHGAQRSVFDANGLFPIHFHSLNGRLDCVKVLLDGETVDMASTHNDTPLHFAAFGGHLNIVKLLLNVGARIGIENDLGRYPLHCAALNGHKEIVQFLVDKYGQTKSGVNILDKSGNSAFSLAASKGHYSVVLYLLEKGGWIIPYGELENLNTQRIGGGGFGEVFLIEWKGKPAALKKVKYDQLIDVGKSAQWITERFILEVALMCKLNSNPSFVPLIGACVEPPYLWMVLEYLSGGSLYSILHGATPEAKISRLPSINSIALSIARGMHYLHTQDPQIIHRDLTTQNVLMDDDGNPFIADFGISRFKFELGDKTMTIIGNPRWKAPEITRGQRYSEKVDVYGFSLLLLECFERLMPFRELDPLPASFKAAKGDRPNLPPQVPTLWANLISSCWENNPSHRPDFATIITIIEKLPLARIPSNSQVIKISSPRDQNANRERTPYY